MRPVGYWRLIRTEDRVKPIEDRNTRILIPVTRKPHTGTAWISPGTLKKEADRKDREEGALRAIAALSAPDHVKVTRS